MLPKGNFFLNSKDRKKLLHALTEQFGIEELPKGVFVQNSKDRVMLLTRDVENIDVDEYYIDSLGLYIGTWQRDGFRLSIEGAQLLAKFTKENIYDLDESLVSDWLKGADIPYAGDECKFVIVRSAGEVLGSGKLRPANEGKDGLILNYTPKSRRLVVVNE